MIEACGVVEGRGHATPEKAEPFEVGDVVVGRATKAVNTVDEEGNPTEQEEEKEGELAATGEVVEVLASEGSFEDEEVEVYLGWRRWGSFEGVSWGCRGSGGDGGDEGRGGGAD